MELLQSCCLHWSQPPAGFRQLVLALLPPSRFSPQWTLELLEIRGRGVRLEGERGKKEEHWRGWRQLCRVPLREGWLAKALARTSPSERRKLALMAKVRWCAQTVPLRGCFLRPHFPKSEHVNSCSGLALSPWDRWRPGQQKGGLWVGDSWGPSQGPSFSSSFVKSAGKRDHMPDSPRPRPAFNRKAGTKESFLSPVLLKHSRRHKWKPVLHTANEAVTTLTFGELGFFNFNFLGALFFKG